MLPSALKRGEFDRADRRRFASNQGSPPPARRTDALSTTHVFALVAQVK